MDLYANQSPPLSRLDAIHESPTSMPSQKHAATCPQVVSQQFGDEGDINQVDLLTRATQAEARASKLEFELERARKALAEAQQRQRDTNQLLRRLGDANALLRADLERERARSKSAACCDSGVMSSDGTGEGSESENRYSAVEAMDTDLDRLRELEGANHNLEARIASELRAAEIWKSRFQALEEVHVSQSVVSPEASAGLGTQSQLARAEVEALRHRVWTMERELQENKQLLASGQAEANKWQKKYLQVEAKSVSSPMHTDAIAKETSMLQELTSMQGEVVRNAFALEEATIAGRGWEANTAAAVAAAGRLERQEGVLSLQLSMTQQRLENVEERLAMAPSSIQITLAHDELRAARADEDGYRRKVKELCSELQTREKSLRSAEFELELERRAQPAECLKAERAAQVAEKNLETLRVAMQAEEKLRLEVSKALSDTQYDARNMQIALHNEERALARCSGDLVIEMSVASKIQDELQQARSEATQADANVSAMQNLLRERCADIHRLESLADLKAEHWKAACHAREKSLEMALAELAETRAEAQVEDSQLQGYSHEVDKSKTTLPPSPDKLNVEALMGSQSLSRAHISELVARLHSTQEECRQAESRLQEEVAQRAAAIAHAAQLTEQIVANGAIKQESSCETFLTRQSRNEARITYLLSEIDDFQAAERASQEVELQAAKKLKLMESEVETFGNQTSELKEVMAQVASLRMTESELNEVESIAAGRITELLAEVSSMRDVNDKCHKAEVEEQKTSMQSAELSVEIDSLRSLHDAAEEQRKTLAEEIKSLRTLHEEALQNSRSAEAVMTGLESECAQKVQASVMSRTALLDELHQSQVAQTKISQSERTVAEQGLALRAEVTSLQSTRDEAEQAEQKAEAQMAELMVEVASLRYLHDHAVHHGKSATLALRDLETESALKLQASAVNRNELMSQLQHYRDMCAQLEHTEQQHSWRLQHSEQSLNIEAAQVAELDTKCSEYTAKCATEASRAIESALRCDELQEEEQRLAMHLEERERYWSLEMAGSMAAADAWHEQCEMQEALFARHFADAEARMGGVASDARQEAAKWCSSLREAKEDLGRWRNRVQELHAERIHMESALEALAHARNTWRAKAEATECQLRKSVAIANNKAEMVVHENQVQTQSELAAARSQLSEIQARSQESLQREKEQLALVEHARDVAQQQVECLREELKSTEASVARHTLLSAETLERARTDTLTISSEAGAWRTSLSEATAKSDSLARHSENLERESVFLRARLATQAEEISEAKARLQKAEHRFSAAESGTDFLHSELSRTRKHSEHVMSALAVEQSDASVLRCRVRELETQLVECSGSYSFKIEDAQMFNHSDKDLTPVPKDSNCQSGLFDMSQSKLDISAELGTLRQELRASRGGEPLSDMTGAWQRVQALEARCSPSAIQGLQASPSEVQDIGSIGAIAQSPTRNITKYRSCGNGRLENNTSLNSIQSPVHHRAEPSPSAASRAEPSPSAASGRSSIRSQRISAEPDALVASISSSSSVATRLSACFSPAKWPAPGTRECSRSPEAPKDPSYDMGLEGFGSQSLECSFGVQPRNILALPASPSPSKCRENLGVAEFGSSGTRGLRF